MNCCIYQDGLMQNQIIKSLSIQKCIIKKISYGFYFCYNEEKKEIVLISEKENFVQNISITLFDEIFQNDDKENIAYFVSFEVEEGLVEFYLINFSLLYYNLTFEKIKNNEKYFDFIKDDHFYRGYDIEWVGKNYQVSDYMSKVLISKSENIIQVRKDIDNFLDNFKNKVNLDLEYHKKNGYEINIISSPKHYVAFPFTFEIKKPDGGYYTPSGISNVFETENEAVEKACNMIYFHSEKI